MEWKRRMEQNGTEQNRTEPQTSRDLQCAESTRTCHATQLFRAAVAVAVAVSTRADVKCGTATTGGSAHLITVGCSTASHTKQCAGTRTFTAQYSTARAPRNIQSMKFRMEEAAVSWER